MASIGGNLLSALTKKLMGAENFGTWKHQIKNLLMLNDLWSYVDGTTVRDPTYTNMQDDYDTKSKVTLALINLSMGGNIIKNVQDAKTPKEAWDAVTNLYETKNDARALMLREQLYGLKLGDGSVVDMCNKSSR